MIPPWLFPRFEMDADDIGNPMIIVLLVTLITVCAVGTAVMISWLVTP